MGYTGCIPPESVGSKSHFIGAARRNQEVEGGGGPRVAVGQVAGACALPQCQPRDLDPASLNPRPETPTLDRAFLGPLDQADLNFY